MYYILCLTDWHVFKHLPRQSSIRMIWVGIKLYENIYPHVRMDVNTVHAPICLLWEEFIRDILDEYWKTEVYILLVIICSLWHNESAEYSIHELVCISCTMKTLSSTHVNMKKSSSGGQLTVEGRRKYFSPGCSWLYQVSPNTTQSTPDPSRTMVRIKLTTFSFSSQLWTRLEWNHDYFIVSSLESTEFRWAGHRILLANHNYIHQPLTLNMCNIAHYVTKT